MLLLANLLSVHRPEHTLHAPFPTPLNSYKFDCVNLGSLYNQFELNMMKRLIEEV